LVSLLVTIPNGQRLPGKHLLRVRGSFGELEALWGSWSQALQHFTHRRRMDLLALSIKLSSLFSSSESFASLLFGGFDVLLDLCADVCHFRSGGFCGFRIGLAYRFGLPFTDSLPHKGGAVGFAHIAAVYKKVNHADISA